MFRAKKEGGVRPIALLGGFLRAWAKVRRSQMQQREDSRDLPRFLGASSRAAERAARDMAACQERGTTVGASALYAQLGADKSRERVGHNARWQEGVRSDANLALLRVSVDIYASNRRRKMGQAHSD